jgi:hypothetical protein
VVKSAQRLGLIDVEDEDDSIHAAEKRGRKGREAFFPDSILTIA